MSHVEIQRVCNVWTLIVSINDQVILSCTDKRLNRLIDTASALQMHISNIDELPLKQYLTLNEEY